MTTQQLHVFNLLCLLVLVVVAVLTRATPRRIAGALAGGAAAGVAALGIIALGEELAWWHMAITWRIARRFGWRGLVAAVIVAAVIGPPRDYWYMAKFPEWGAYAPGAAPVLAISATYVLLGILGHGVMRLVAGPAREDRLARRPWKAARPTAC